MKKKVSLIIFGVLIVLVAILAVLNQESSMEGRIIQPTSADVKIVTVEKPDHSPTEVDISNWPFYVNDRVGISFRYPPFYKVFEITEFPSVPAAPDFYENVLLWLNIKEKDDFNSRGHVIAVFSEHHPVTKESMEHVEQNSDNFDFHMVDSPIGKIEINYSKNSILKSYGADFVVEDYALSVQTLSYPMEELQAILSTIEI